MSCIPRLSTRRRCAALAAMGLALIPSLAAAAAPVCLSQGEATGLLSYSMPQVIRASGQRCKASLPADAFLPARAEDLARRYEGQKAGYWPQAKAAFFKLSSAKDPAMAQVFQALPDDSLRAMVDVMATGIVSQSIPVDACARIDKAANLLSPLPPENLAGLIALALEAGADRKTDEAKPAVPRKGLSALTICKS